MQKFTTIVTCDLCGLPDATETRFGLGGKEYAIDLCEKDRANLDSAFEPYLTKGRKVPNRTAIDKATRHRKQKQSARKQGKVNQPNQ